MTHNKLVINVQIGIMVVSLCKNPQDDGPQTLYGKTSICIVQH